jgi:type I restriction enzyme S subunit
VNQHVCIIRTVSHVIPKYLSYWLNSPLAQDRIFAAEAGVTREGLNYAQIRSLPIPITSTKTQNKVIMKIEELFSFAEQIEKSVHEAKKRTDIIDQAILSKAFRGELVPQDPKDEPASVLLDRIRQEKELEIKQTSIE